MTRGPISREETAAKIRLEQMAMVERARQELKAIAAAKAAKHGKES